MKQDIRVSVIVPIYNIENYVCKCIESILNQNYKNLEIILVDDGSTDESGIICDKFAEKDSRIIVIHKQNGGLVSARKAGADVATGEYIASVDGDDWIERTYIESFVQAIRQKECDVIWNISLIKEYADRQELNLPRFILNKDISQEKYQREIYNCVCGLYGYQNDIDYSICLRCVRKDIYIDVQNVIDNRITRGEDLAFSVVMLGKTNSIYFIRNDGYHYVQRETSYTYNVATYSNDAIDVLKDYFDKYGKSAFIKIKHLKNQVKGYLISTYMLQAFGSMQNSKLDYLYPFKGVLKGSKIIIYGAGSIGKNIVSFLNNSSDFDMVAWVDSKVGATLFEKWEIRSVEEIKNISFDYIILATNRTMYIREMRENLKNMEIDDKKIVSAFDDL